MLSKQLIFIGGVTSDKQISVFETLKISLKMYDACENKSEGMWFFF